MYTAVFLVMKFPELLMDSLRNLNDLSMLSSLMLSGKTTMKTNTKKNKVEVD